SGNFYDSPSLHSSGALDDYSFVRSCVLSQVATLVYSLESCECPVVSSDSTSSSSTTVDTSDSTLSVASSSAPQAANINIDPNNRVPFNKFFFINVISFFW